MGDMVFQVNTTKRTIVWILFWLSVVLTWVIYLKAWVMPSYYLILYALAALNCCLGALIVATDGFALRSMLLMVLGIAVGQWWLIERLVVQAIWGMSGLAP